MFTLHVEGETVTEVVTKTMIALGLTPNTAASVPAPGSKAPPAASTPPPAAKPLAVKPSTKRHRRTKAEIAADAKAKGISKVPASHGAVASTTPPPATPSVVPKEVDPFNTDPISAPAENSGEVITVSYEDMKAALHKVAAARPADVGNAGMQRVKDILARYGVQKIKDVPPEHFAGIVTDCETSQAEVQK